MAKLRVREVAEAQGIKPGHLHMRANQIASAAGSETTISYTTVLGLYYNRTQRPDLDILEIVADALGVEPGELVARGKSGVNTLENIEAFEPVHA